MTGAALLIVAILMVGLGLSLTIGDFRRVGQYRRTIAVALACQLLALPVVCFAIVTVLDLPPVSAMGLMLLSAAPGGPMAGVYSHLFGGDVAFNLTLAAINSVLSVVTLPIVTALAVQHFLGRRDGVGLHFSEVLTVMGVVLVPIALGMLVRAKAPRLAARAEPVFRVVAVVALVALIASGFGLYFDLLVESVGTVLPAAVLFATASLATGYLAGRLTRAPHRVAVAACMEIGFHNAAIAISIAAGLLNSFAMTIPPSIYGLTILVLAAVAGLLVRRLSRPASAGPASARPAPSPPAPNPEGPP
ncbi:bile acid:sodium symporter family protein [Cryptosporangium minutisporangium]|uniref:Bile acid:sodium symporter family protein n=1 Tax=Cryptosporangium minutisporangium TaxID=113569 RepID=A0ABP6SRH1_9ACTN